MNCEYEHNYATENVYNTVRECHQNCKKFIRSLMRKSEVKYSLKRVNDSIIHVLLSLHIQIPVNSCSSSGTFTGGLKYLRLLVTDLKQLLSYKKAISHPSTVILLF